MTIKQVSIETKLKLIGYKSPNKYDHLVENIQYSELDKILFNSNLSLLDEPINYNSGYYEISRLNLGFNSLNKNNKINFVEIHCDELFHLKLNNCYIISTTKFSYFNYNKCITLDIANGTLRLEENNSFTLLPSTKDITIRYFTGYFENNKYLNIQWTNQNA